MAPATTTEQDPALSLQQQQQQQQEQVMQQQEGSSCSSTIGDRALMVVPALPEWGLGSPSAAVWLRRFPKPARAAAARVLWDGF
jgi:hypothetical protein